MVPEGLAAPVPVLGMESMGGSPREDRGPPAAQPTLTRPASLTHSQAGWRLPWRMPLQPRYRGYHCSFWFCLPYQKKLMVMVIVKAVNTVKP